MNESRFISRFNLDLNSSQPFGPHYFSQVYIKHNMCLCTCLQAKPIRLCKCVCSSKGPEVQALALFINTSVELTVHSRGGLQGKELGHSPHKKSLLIYFPSNWKVHAHTWLNHHASTEDGPPAAHRRNLSSALLHGLGTARHEKTHECTAHPVMDSADAGLDSLVLNMASAIQKSFIKFVILLFFIPVSLTHWSGWPQNALSLFLMLHFKACSYYPFL